MSSILARLKKQSAQEGKKLFCIVAGVRLAGKTTLIGTLPGKTLLLQASARESGSESAKKLAKKLGNDLDVLSFASLAELAKDLNDLLTDAVYDNIAVDGLSAVTEMKYEDPKTKALVKTDNWQAFREIGDTATQVILAMKRLTEPSETTNPKNTFLTVALSIKQDKNGAIVDVSLDVKGNVATSAVTKFGEAVVTVLPPSGEKGAGEYRLLTRTEDVWPGRIDGILREDNPGSIEPASLAKLLEIKASA